MNKINIKFNPQHKNKDTSLILLSVTWQGNRIQRSAGISIETKYFNLKKGRMKRNHKNSLEINKYFDDIESEIKSFYLSRKANKEDVSKKILKQKIDDIFNPKEQKNEKKKELDFFKEYDKFINVRKKSQSVSPRTIQRYKVTQNHLKNFAAKERKKITFDSFDEDFANDFVVYLIKDLKLVNQTVEAVVKNLKVFLNFAIEREITNNLSFKKSFKKAVQNFRLKTHTEQIALTMEDIEKISSFSTDNNLLDKTRDLFLIQIYTALRVSDLMRLTYNHISLEEGIIRLHNKKTSEYVEVPIHKRLRELLMKYKETGLPRYSEPVYNRNIKTVCKEAGLTDKITRTFHYGKNQEEKTFEKWELIRSHVARGTGITELVRRNVPDRKIMPTVGIKKQDTLGKYVRLANKEPQEAVKNAWDRE